MHDIKMGFIDTVNDNIIDSAIKKTYKGGNLKNLCRTVSKLIQYTNICLIRIVT